MQFYIKYRKVFQVTIFHWISREAKQRILNKQKKVCPLGTKLACNIYVAFQWSGFNKNKAKNTGMPTLVTRISCLKLGPSHFLFGLLQ